ncbi:MAG: hypothetical protein OEY79_02640 [Anaplasmataceae bacterium]|nr:hypothetical protein [Candidatus Heimdallarchaeota archaeon]MDH5796420.1 hypothetical protein [Anaplasmataceae bacterium]
MNKIKEIITKVISKDHKKFIEGIDFILKIENNKKKNSTISPISGFMNLPNGIGRNLRLLIISNGIDVNYPYSNKGADDLCGGDELIKKLKDRDIKLNFDYCLSDIKTLPSLSSIARILGPPGLMPSIKKGTADNNLSSLIADFVSNGRILFKSDKFGNIHLRIGSRNFGIDEIYENIKSVISYVKKLKYDDNRSIIIHNKSIIKTTMGKPFFIDISDI